MWQSQSQGHHINVKNRLKGRKRKKAGEENTKNVKIKSIVNRCIIAVWIFVLVVLWLDLDRKRDLE